MDELAPSRGVGSIGWELVVCYVDVRRVAEVVGIPSESWGSLGGGVDAMCRRERRVLREDAHRGKKRTTERVKKVKSNNHGSTTALEADQPHVPLFI